LGVHADGLELINGGPALRPKTSVIPVYNAACVFNSFACNRRLTKEGIEPFMSKMPEYDPTAGFPMVHVEAFKRVACRNRMVISSRELNPLCTDLVLEGYAAKGFHIKAKTCDWGPMAGFVPEDHRFTKGKQKIEDQQRDIVKAFGHHARCVPLFISDDRFQKLKKCGLVSATSSKGLVSEVTASPEGSGTTYKFTLVKLTVQPPGCEKTMWAVYYHPGETEVPSTARHVLTGDFPQWPGLRPVYGMTNPDSDAKLGVRAAVAGDYDLWCIFPHASIGGAGVADRLMPLRANLISSSNQGTTMGKLLKKFGDAGGANVRPPGAFVTQQAQAAKLVFASGQERVKLADDKEDKHLGNISHTVMKIRNELNVACNSKAGNVVQHSDYGGNPFATIDYPLIFFVPDPDRDFSHADAPVASNLAELKPILRDIQSQGYILKLNPAWSMPLF
jgi:hypothetical protein